MMTVGNSRPLAACSVMSQMRASTLPCPSSTSDSSESLSVKPPSEASGSRPSYSREADTSSIRFSIRLCESSLLSSRRSCRYPLWSRTLPSVMDSGSLRATSDRFDDEIAKRAQRRRRALRHEALVDGPVQLRPQRVRRGHGDAAREQQRRRLFGRDAIDRSPARPRPMPRVGTLMTRRRLTSSCGLSSSFR